MKVIKPEPGVYYPGYVRASPQYVMNWFTQAMWGDLHFTGLHFTTGLDFPSVEARATALVDNPAYIVSRLCRTPLRVGAGIDDVGEGAQFGSATRRCAAVENFAKSLAVICSGVVEGRRSLGPFEWRTIEANARNGGIPWNRKLVRRAFRHVGDCFKEWNRGHEWATENEDNPAELVRHKIRRCASPANFYLRKLGYDGVYLHAGSFQDRGVLLVEEIERRSGLDLRTEFDGVRGWLPETQLLEQPEFVEAFGPVTRLD